MALPNDTSTILVFMGYEVLNDFSVTKHQDGTIEIDWWNAAAGPMPTEQEIQNAHDDLTAVSGQTYSQWYCSKRKPAVVKEADRRVSLAFGADPSDVVGLYRVQMDMLSESVFLVDKKTAKQGGTLTPDEEVRLADSQTKFVIQMGTARLNGDAMQAEMDAIAVDVLRTPDRRRADLDLYVRDISMDAPTGPRTIGWI